MVGIESVQGAWSWILLGLGALLIGLSKTGVPGVGILAVALFSAAVPAKASVGLVLVLLICADFVAVAAYARHAVWSHLWKLFPWTITGVVQGWMAMGRLDELQMRRLIGGIVFGLVLYRLWERRRPAAAPSGPKHWSFAAGTGLLAGFTTMTANAAGPIMILYLLASGLPKMEFMGTGAWYFLLMNCFKVPFSWQLGLIHLESLKLDLLLAPLALAGAFIGKWVLKRIPQASFEVIALCLTLLASLKLLL
jgi:uncharacterized membrane protein YfcA